VTISRRSEANLLRESLELRRSDGGLTNVFFLVVGLLCHHTASNPITTQMHTSGVQ